MPLRVCLQAGRPSCLGATERRRRRERSARAGVLVWPRAWGRQSRRPSLGGCPVGRRETPATSSPWPARHTALRPKCRDPRPPPTVRHVADMRPAAARRRGGPALTPLRHSSPTSPRRVPSPAASANDRLSWASGCAAQVSVSCSRSRRARWRRSARGHLPGGRCFAQWGMVAVGLKGGRCPGCRNSPCGALPLAAGAGGRRPR